MVSEKMTTGATEERNGGKMKKPSDFSGSIWGDHPKLKEVKELWKGEEKAVAEGAEVVNKETTNKKEE